MPKKWSREVVIDEILSLHKKGEGLNSGYIQKHYPTLIQAALYYIGSWQLAIEAAGFDYTKASVRRIKKREFSNQETVVQKILNRELARKPLNSATVAVDEPSLYAQALRHFGSWAKAIEASGIDYLIVCKYRRTKRQKRGWWTKTRILQTIRLLERSGWRLSSKEIMRSKNALFQTAVVYFGSWSQAVEAAGIAYQSHCRRWSTKAWLRRMDDAQYSSTLKRAETHAQKRRRRK